MQQLALCALILLLAFVAVNFSKPVIQFKILDEFGLPGDLLVHGGTIIFTCKNNDLTAGRPLLWKASDAKREKYNPQTSIVKVNSDVMGHYICASNESVFNISDTSQISEIINVTYSPCSVAECKNWEATANCKKGRKRMCLKSPYTTTGFTCRMNETWCDLHENVTQPANPVCTKFNSPGSTSYCRYAANRKLSDAVITHGRLDTCQNLAKLSITLQFTQEMATIFVNEDDMQAVSLQALRKLEEDRAEITAKIQICSQSGPAFNCFNDQRAGSVQCSFRAIGRDAVPFRNYSSVADAVTASFSPRTLTKWSTEALNIYKLSCMTMPSDNYQFHGRLLIYDVSKIVAPLLKVSPQMCYEVTLSNLPTCELTWPYGALDDVDGFVVGNTKVSWFDPLGNELVVDSNKAILPFDAMITAAVYKCAAVVEVFARFCNPNQDVQLHDVGPTSSLFDLHQVCADRFRPSMHNTSTIKNAAETTTFKNHDGSETSLAISVISSTITTISAANDRLVGAAAGRMASVDSSITVLAIVFLVAVFRDN